MIIQKMIFKIDIQIYSKNNLLKVIRHISIFNILANILSKFYKIFFGEAWPILNQKS